MRSVFAVAQISLAVALVVGAALMSKGMFSLLHLADEYHPANVLVFNVSLPEKRYDTRQKQAAWYNQSLERLRALPGVTHAEVTGALPYSDNGWLQDLEIQDRPAMPGKFQSALHLPVSQGYFESSAYSDRRRARIHADRIRSIRYPLPSSAKDSWRSTFRTRIRWAIASGLEEPTTS